MRWVVILACVVMGGWVSAGEPVEATVAGVWFRSELPQPVHRLPPDLQKLADGLPRWRSPAVEAIGLWGMIGASPARFGLSAEQAVAMRDAIRTRYAAMGREPAMKGVESAWPEAIADDSARRGHYFLIRPAVEDPALPVIVFLHGWGGNFLFYTDFLRQALPEYTIIVPSYGLSWGAAPAAYLDEILEHASKRLDREIERPVLMVISAGGPAGFRAVNVAPEKFRGLLALATTPAPGQTRKLPVDLPVMLLVGQQDTRFPIADVRRIAESMAARLTRFQMSEMDADHFFLLTHSAATSMAMRRWLLAL